MKKIKMPVIICLLVICLIFGILTTFNYSMFDIFAYSSNPTYPWQYFSGAFMHGSKLAPISLIWFHIVMNFLLIFVFGGLVEKEKGSKYSFIIFIVALIISSIVANITLYGKELQATGISGVGYAYITAGTIYIFSNWNKVSKVRKMFVTMLLLLSITVLIPTILGWSSTLVHTSGIISYLLIFFVEKIYNKSTS